MQLLLWLLLVIRVANAITWPWESGSDEDDRNPYQPYETSCPSTNLLREASSKVNSHEKNYIKQRYEKTNTNLADFLDNVAQLNDFNASQFIDQYAGVHNITIGLAFSGGGYRAMLSGAGQLTGLDNRYLDSNSKALGGLLQSSSYITGLSGGSWLIGTLLLNDWITVDDILSDKNDIWNLDDSIFNPNGINLYKTAKYYTNIGTSLYAKGKQFETTITDIWGKAIGYQFMPYNGGQNLTWSYIRNLSSFQDYDVPFPIVLSNGRNPGTTIVNLNSTVFEFNPYEFGSWDPSVNSFVDTQYIGTYLDNGKPNSTESCVVNYDNAGFIMGTSSSIFNQFLTRLDLYDVNKLIKSIVKKLLSMVAKGEDDIAVYKPNPFYNSEHGSSDNLLSNDSLFLVDGGEDDQNIPLHPLIQPQREVDVIFAFDNSADDTYDWPNGSALIHTFRRQFGEQGRGSPVPFVPQTFEDFVESGFNEEPGFFGCDSSMLDDLVKYHENDDLNSTDVPLIIYVPNSYQSYNANSSTFKLSYKDEERQSIITNGYETVSRGNLSDDRQWPTCVGCALIRRTQERMDLTQSEECKKCFKKYCWEPSDEDLLVKSLASEFSSSSASTSTGTSTGTSTKSPAKTHAPSTSTSSDDGDDSGGKGAKGSQDGASAAAVSWWLAALALLCSI